MISFRRGLWAWAPGDLWGRSFGSLGDIRGSSFEKGEKYAGGHLGEDFIQVVEWPAVEGSAFISIGDIGRCILIDLI